MKEFFMSIDWTIGVKELITIGGLIVGAAGFGINFWNDTGDLQHDVHVLQGQYDQHGERLGDLEDGQAEVKSKISVLDKEMTIRFDSLEKGQAELRALLLELRTND